MRAHVREAARRSSTGWPRSGSRLVGIGGAVRNLAAAAQQVDGAVDLGVQGFVILPSVLDELVSRAGGDAGRRARRRSRGSSPGAATSSSPPRWCSQTVVELGGFDGIEATEAGLRDGVFLARTLLAGSEPLFDGRPRGGRAQPGRSSTSPTWPTSSTSRGCRCRCSTSSSRGGCSRRPTGERELLWAASMLHDVGMTISYDDHHKHSRYLIESAELPGFDPRERALIAQMSRYHRKGMPKLGVIEPLTRAGDEELLERCAVILRLAEHLERGRDQSVSRCACAPTATASTCTSRPTGT